MVVFLTEEEEDLIVQAIQKAERGTSGEIRVHICSKSKSDEIKHAQKIFHQLNMHETQEKNGILIHISILEKAFSIIGDSGIDKLTPDDFWESIKLKMQNHFKKQEFAQGIIKGIEDTGKALKEYFPYQENDINELADEISKT